MANDRTALTAPKDVFALIDSNSFKQELARALPNTLKPERMVRLALTMLRKNSTLSECSPVSIMACVVECAQLGLEPEGVLGHAYLVPYKNEATLIIGYRGFSHLMYQSGTISAISAEIVRPGDKFKQTLGTNRGLHHEPGPIPKNDSPEHWRGAYAVVEFVTGRSAFEYLERSKIEDARGRSASWRAFKKYGYSTPWNTDTEEMWRKTPIRRIAKRMPTSTTDKRPEILRAAMLDEYGERKGLLLPTLGGFEVNPTPPEPEDPTPISPTKEAPLEVIDLRGSDSSATNEPAKPEGKAKKAAPAREAAAPPKAKIPPAPKVEPPKPDPLITTQEQTDIMSAAVKAGWQVPDEVRKLLKRDFKLDSIRDVRRSQLPAILGKINSGE